MAAGGQSGNSGGGCGNLAISFGANLGKTNQNLWKLFFYFLEIVLGNQFPWTSNCFFSNYVDGSWRVGTLGAGRERRVRKTLLVVGFRRWEPTDVLTRGSHQTASQDRDMRVMLHFFILILVFSIRIKGSFNGHTRILAFFVAKLDGTKIRLQYIKESKLSSF